MRFTARRCPRADDADTVRASVGMSDKHQPLFRCHPYRDESAFVNRVIRIIEGLGERIQEYALGPSIKMPCLRSLAPALAGSHS
jgi:hypothetical protein